MFRDYELFHPLFIKILNSVHTKDSFLGNEIRQFFYIPVCYYRFMVNFTTISDQNIQQQI